MARAISVALLCTVGFTLLLLPAISGADPVTDKLQKACDGGDDKACTNLGLRYVRGDGVKANADRGAELFAAACQADEPTGCLNLGLLFATGTGVTQKPEKAAGLFARGCDKGSIAACHLRAQVLFHGQGVAQDPATASRLFGQACDGGMAKACHALSALLEQGAKGVTQDLDKAEKLLRKACKGGVTSACQALRTRRLPLLWRFSAASPSYLIGLSHLDVGIWDLPDSVRKAITSCKTLVFEVDSAKIEPATVVRLSSLAKGASLRTILGAKGYDNLQAELSLPPAMVDRMKPWKALASLLQKWRPVKRSLRSQLINRARRSGQKVAFLEPPAGQLQAANTVASPEQVKALLSALADPKASRKHMDDTVAAFRRGDAATLHRLAFEVGPLHMSSSVRKRLYDDRHKEWLQGLRGQLGRGETCLLVAAEHLVGERGLARRLRGKGRTIVRVIR